jgi:V/A-type H+-transporting ATPase subunit C
MIEFKADVRYSYSTGRIRVLETKLLSTSKVEKMIDSPTVNDALIYLEDTAYDDTIGELTEPEKYPEYVHQEKDISFTLMDRLIYDDTIKQIFRIPYDFHNLKVLLKQRLSGIVSAPILSDFGTVPSQEIKTAFETETFSPLPEFMSETIGESLAHHYMKKNMKTMEFLIDNLEYSRLLSLAEETGVPFLIHYIKTKIDLTNISTFLRIKYFNTQDNYEDALIDGGTIPLYTFLPLSGEGIEMVPPYFKNSVYHHIIEEGTKKILEKGSFSILDRESDNFIMDYIRLTRYITFGVEPVVSYFISRDRDVNIMKMILVGKVNEIPEQEMRERIPKTFN